ncbi:MAG TPA: TonB-dependent receptor [Sphingomicrobium sp.]|nr:TonB-dependent receptor [Sphingomicrobium sp.]
MGTTAAGAAQAQTPDAVAASSTASQDGQTPGDKAPARASADIIVTAQRRSESLQNVPMTLQALSGDTLKQFNVVTFDDLLKYTPNVTFGSNGPGAGAIFMRGLSAGFVGNQSSATIAPFPNVALYLDEQSMQFPARNADVYMVDMERVEVLEGPQGTLFGGGAEAGAVRYITNKPILSQWGGHVEGTYGGTTHGAANSAFNGTINIPVGNRIALRATVYHERQGGYIDNVSSSVTRSNIDGGNAYFNLHPTSGNICPDGLPSSNGLPSGLCALPASQQSNAGQYSNAPLASKDFNPVTYQGARVSAKWGIAPDWDVLISESLQDMDAQGSSAQEPIGLNFQPLGKLQTTIFTPSYNKDRYWNTAWTLSGKIADFKVIYTGGFMTRHIEDQQDYTNYSRTAAGMYYQCTGGTTGWGLPTQTPLCYSPIGYWHDKVRNTHQSHELRIASPEDKRVRFIAGAYWERFKIYDIMDFNYKTIPACTAAILAQGTTCSGLLPTIPNTTANQPGIKGPTTAFGEDTQRGYDQYAFFGSVDFDLLPNLTITGGTRYYNYDEFEVGGQYQTYADNCVNVLICAVAHSGNVNIDNNHDHVKYHGFKSRGVITWKPLAHTMIYGLFSQGFRPGGFNRATKLILPDPAPPHGPQFLRPNSYAPDSLTNWEAGIKTDLFNHMVQFNLSAYYMVWENTQIGFYNPAAGFGNTSFVTNGPTYHIKGAELQLLARPARGLTLQGAVTYNDSKQSNSPCFISNVQGSSTFGQCITAQFKKGVVTPVLNPFGLPGGATPFTPKVQADIRLRYEWEMQGLKWFATGAAAYTGAMYSEPNTYPSGDNVSGVFGTTQYRYRQPAYTLVDASLGFSKGNYTASLFVKNLFDSNASTFTSSPQFIKAEVPVRPRTFGVRLGMDL